MSNIVIFNLFFRQRVLLVYALKPAAARVHGLVYFGQVKLAVFLYFQGSMVMEVEAVDGDAGVGNEVFNEIISGKLNHNNLEIRRIRELQ